MKLFHISQEENNDYDTYSDAVVVAENADEAQKINLNSYEFTKEWNDDDSYGSTWASKPENVVVKYIGESIETVERIVCASFHAG